MKQNLAFRTIILTALLLVSLASRGQDDGFITLYGHVVDKSSSKSLFYSSVNLSGTNISNVSNSDGYFSLKIPDSTSPDAVIFISHLGYQTASVKISDFENKTSAEALEIKLISTPITLDPATVRVIEADELVRSAFFKIKDNYPTSPVGMTAFYREMIRKGATRYLTLNEAVIDINKAPYTGFASDRVGIYKGRGCTNYESSDTLMMKFQGGIITALQLDQVKHPFAGVFLNEILTTYYFQMDGVITYDGHNFFKVGFRPKTSVKEIMFKGFIYIETESLAIGCVEMEMDLAGREEEASSIFILKRPMNTRFYINKAQYVVRYKCYDGTWYYDYCRADLSISTRKSRSLFKKHFFLTEEMAVTDHKDGGIAIEPANRIKFKDILSEKVADFADNNFWGEYNVIEPDQSIETIIKKIVHTLKKR